MNKDAIAFLDGESVEEPEVEEAEAVAEAEPEQVEAEAEAEPETQTGEEQEAEPPSAAPKESDRIPVTALLDEREKRQEAQRKAEEADRKLKQYEQELRRIREARQEAPPDWYDDPQKAAQYQQRTIEQRFEAQRMQQSKFFAEREFGADVVNEAVAYFDAHPQQSQQFLAHPSPFHAAVEFYRKQKVADEIGADPEAYKAKLREELLAELQASQGSQFSSKPKAPPPSMAKAPAAGKEAISSGSAFDMLFPD